ncbi:unnamed protein product [Periconia digitata]|uniref:Uncharacterized protein n=1 Tax=Periconia digitata TaxID=1303443 RepID=A0A9W4U1F2_9PLEO|nr:unnamed protein product [Periconia digitata]
MGPCSRTHFIYLAASHLPSPHPHRDTFPITAPILWSCLEIMKLVAAAVSVVAVFVPLLVAASPLARTAGYTLSAAHGLDRDGPPRVDDSVKTFESKQNPLFKPTHVWLTTLLDGELLLTAMKESDKEAGLQLGDSRQPPSVASVWQGNLTEDLRKWYWSDSQPDKGILENILRTTRHYGILDSEVAIHQVEHLDPNKKDSDGGLLSPSKQNYSVDGQEYRATGARFLFCFSHGLGLIYTQHGKSLSQAAKEEWRREVKQEELPLLNTMSDILWAYWSRNNSNVQNINYIWVEEVMEDTMKLIARILDKTGDQLGRWPVETFESGSEVGNILIGSDEGTSIAWFLLQHKAQLGNKYISRIQIIMDPDWFEQNVSPKPHLLFHVEDAPPPERNTITDYLRILANSTQSNDALQKTSNLETSTAIGDVEQPNKVTPVNDLASISGVSPAMDELRKKKRTSSRLAARGFDPDDPADDQLLENYKCKGGQLLETMRADDKRAGQIYGDRESMQSMFSDDKFQEDMKTWGWSVKHVNQDLVCDFSILAFPKELHLSAKPKHAGGNNWCFEWLHGVSNQDDPSLPRIKDQTYKVNGKQYKMTGASYLGGVNAKDGLIMAFNVKSPANSFRTLFGYKPSPEELPTLRYMSDVFWGQWALENPDVKNLKYIWVNNVVNRDTEKLVNRIIMNHGGQLKPWPGTEFKHDSDEAKALIGSPNGWTWGHMLEAHKKELGRKWISKVTVFDSEEYESFEPNIELLFWVEDAPSDGDGNAAVFTADTELKLIANATAADIVEPTTNSNVIDNKRRPRRHASSELETRGFNPKRTCSDDQWNAAVCKGARHVEAMKGDDTKAGQVWDKNPPTLKSQWKDSEFKNDFKKWGWFDVTVDDSMCDYTNDGGYDYDRAFKQLGWNGKSVGEGGDMRCFSMRHKSTNNMETKYVVDGKEYLYTGGEYDGATNLKGGALVAQSVGSPYHEAKELWEPVDVNLLPRLRTMSDLFWGAWINNNPNVKDIKYFWVQDVLNDQTSDIVAYAFRRANQPNLEMYPGHQFDGDSDEAKALIGSPNGYTWGYFLSSHKEQLGNKWISHVVVLNAYDDEEGNHENPPIDLIFVVDDVHTNTNAMAFANMTNFTRPTSKKASKERRG